MAVLYHLCLRQNGLAATAVTTAKALATSTNLNFQTEPALPNLPTTTATKPLSDPDYSVRFFTRLDEALPDWSLAAPSADVFLQPAYLRALELAPPSKMRFGYLVFYKNGHPTGVAYCQISPFNAGENIQAGEKKSRFPCLMNAFARFLKSTVASGDHYLLVCGNLLLSGEHGFHFSEPTETTATCQMLEEALLIAQESCEQAGMQVDGIFIKDIGEAHREPCKVLVGKGFKEFTFHPNMVIRLRQSWASFEDYMQDISSKYKVRARKAFKNFMPLAKRELYETEIYEQQHLLYQLYRQIANNQDFNMVTLNEEYFSCLRQNMGNSMRVFGYFLNGRLVGYYTTILNGEELEAHFLGYEQELNRQHQIYHNILFDLLRHGIEQRVKRVVLARTAMEIKSTLGAEPHDMLCYIRANNRLINRILPPVLEYLRPPADWIQRNPFKDEETGLAKR